MLRSFRFRALALFFCLAAGSSEPAWELAHVLEHQHELAERDPHARPLLPSDGLALVAADHEHDHGHPVLEAGLRPARDLFTPDILTPAEPEPSLEGNLVLDEVLPTAPPPPPPRSPSLSSRPRAPPLR